MQRKVALCSCGGADFPQVSRARNGGCSFASLTFRRPAIMVSSREGCSQHGAPKIFFIFGLSTIQLFRL